MNKIKNIQTFFLLLFITAIATAQTHPKLMLTPKGVATIRAELGKVPLFDAELKATIEEVNAEIEEGIHVPIPKDMAGGYTHERHKKNFFILQKAGNLFQITGDEKYAIYIRDMLLEYAKIYPKLGLHPANKSYATGKIFWQCLNDANWLVYVSQAYDCIYDWLPIKQRKHLENDLFRPFADFLSIGNPQFYNRIHNHSTWGNAAVGMIGLAMDDEELVNRALYGLKSDDIPKDLMDNDGGFIKIEGQKSAGFLAQLDYSFSPDGYFTEGPYYLRYAMSPFLLFAKSLSNSRPDLNIFNYRDKILQKSVYALLNQTDANGVFFPINDSQKGMSWLAREVIAAVDIAYYDFGNDPELLSIAALQEQVLLDETGFAVAKDLAKGLAQSFEQKPIAYTDGADGKQGGVGILRTKGQESGELCLVMKYSEQGMGHGHFDKLSYSLYDESGEVIQDYGAARWVNIDQKGGGRYLPENNTFAKQSIAHNTVVVNEKSHYNGDIKIGSKYAPIPYYFNAENDALQIVSAKSSHAYEGVEMHRTMVLLKNESFHKPILIDLFRMQSDSAQQYDLPTWFQGHLLSNNFEYKAETESLKPIGKEHGYQHIWKEAQGKADGKNAKLTWFLNGKFFSMTALTSKEDDLIFARSGANDSNFNLRHDPTFIIRKNEAKNALFCSVIEPHGNYNPVGEIPHSPFSSIDKLEVIVDTEDYTIVSFSNQKEKVWTLMLANQDNSEETQHAIEVDGKTYEWKGVFSLMEN